MPNLDRTGPNSQGPMTGRKSGRCNNNKTVKTSDNVQKDNEVVYGAGRGGRPWGGGLGKCFGGGRNRGRGKGFGRNRAY
jgi:hypothetical protein